MKPVVMDEVSSGRDYERDGRCHSISITDARSVVEEKYDLFLS